MPFLLSGWPAQPFGSWLKQADADTAAGMIAGTYGPDIGDEASPRDVRDVLRMQGAPAGAREVFMEAVREWYAGLILLDFDADSDRDDSDGDDDTLTAWPKMDFAAGIDPPAEQVTCGLCGHTAAGPLPFMVLAQFAGEDEPRFACSDCAAIVPRGAAMWKLAEAEHKRQGESGP